MQSHGGLKWRRRKRTALEERESIASYMLAFSSSARDERERPADGLSFHGESWTRTFFNGQKPPARSSGRDKREELVVSRDAAVSWKTVFVTGRSLSKLVGLAVI